MCSESQAFVAFAIIYGLYVALCLFYPADSASSRAKAVLDLADIRQKIRRRKLSSALWTAGYPVVYLAGLPFTNPFFAFVLCAIGLLPLALCGQAGP